MSADLSRERRDAFVVAVITPFFPPLGRVGGVIRLVKFLEYADPTRWTFEVLTPAPGYTVYPYDSESSSLLPSVPKNVHITRRKSLIRFPKWLFRNRVGTGTTPNPAASATAQKSLSARILGIVNRSLLIPDEDIIWMLGVLPFALLWIYRRRASVIYASGPQYSFLLLGYLLARVRRTPLVVDMRDDWLENSTRRQKPAFVLSLEMALERRILNYASRTIVPTQYGVESLLRRHHRLAPGKVVHVPNGFDLSEFQIARKSFVSQESNQFEIVCASGGLSPGYRDLRPFLVALSQVRLLSGRGAEKVKVVFLGSDVFIHYGDFIKEHKLESCIRGRSGLSRIEYITYLLKAQALLLIQMDNAPSSIPGTVYEYAAVGGPPIILVGGDGATKDFVERHGLGISCAMNNPDAIANTIQKLFEEWEQGIPKAPAGILEPSEFDRQHIALKFCKILEDACFRSHYQDDGVIVESSKTPS